MTYSLIWSDRALREYDKLVEYLFEEWGESITSRIITEIKETSIRIGDSPEQFPYYKETKKIRRCIASPQTSMYFKIAGDKIEILSVFDNRKNPKKRKL